MKKILVLLLSVGMYGILLSGCGGQQTEAEEVVEKVPVKVTTVQLGDVVQSLTYNGDINAEFDIKVFSKIPDRIERFYVDEGDYVEKGQIIAKILATTIEQGVRQAEAALVAAKAQEANLRVEYERAQRLSKQDAMSQQQFDAVKTQYEAIQAQAEQAEAMVVSTKSQLKDATITAPISGIIGQRFYETGDMASPAMPVVSIVQMDRVKIVFDVTEGDYGRMEIGQNAEIKVRSFPDRIFTGKVSKISPVLDPLTRMAKVEVLISNKDKKLKPGMFGDVTVVTGILKDVLSVPRYATIENTSLAKEDGKDKVVKKYSVFVIENDKALTRVLDVNYVNHVRIAINGGVTIGEKLVIEGHNNLRDSTLVTVTEEEAAL